MWLCLPDVWLLPFLKGHKYMWYKNISNETQINFEHDQVIYITGMLWWHVVHDHQNTVPMMTTVPALSMTIKTLCQWWPLYQRCPWPPKHCANNAHCANVDQGHQSTVPMMTSDCLTGALIPTGNKYSKVAADLQVIHMDEIIKCFM